MASHPNPELSKNSKGFHSSVRGSFVLLMLGEGENGRTHQSTKPITGSTVAESLNYLQDEYQELPWQASGEDSDQWKGFGFDPWSKN